MKTLLVVLAMLALAASAQADTLVLDVRQGGLYPLYPTYLNASCGGVQYNEEATGFNMAGNATTQARFYTSCSTGGRGTHPRRYVKLWSMEYATNGQLVNATLVAYCTWLQTQPAQPGCDLTADPNAVFTLEDMNGNLLATLGTSLVGASYRAYVDSNAAAYVPPTAPNVVGLTDAQANGILTAAGLIPAPYYTVTTAYPPGKVFYQTPAAGAVVSNQTVIHYGVARAAPIDD
jgi:hypothetical protein